MAAPARELVSTTTRALFRALATGSTVGKIRTAFTDEGFAPASGSLYVDSSERRTLTQHFLDGVDWTHPGQVGRALRVFERLVWPLRPEPGSTYEDWEMFTRSLRRDGYVVRDDGSIAPTRAGFPDAALAQLGDAASIHALLDRIARALPDDPALAIGCAKELIESTAKVVLAERGVVVDDHADIQQLIRRTQDALLLRPDADVPGPDGTDAVKKILGGLSAVAIGVAELRTRGYGTGHGPKAVPAGLHVRHAQLAVNAAFTWCRLVLDTLADPAAPWRDAHHVAGETRAT